MKNTEVVDRPDALLSLATNWLRALRILASGVCGLPVIVHGGIPL